MLKLCSSFIPAHTAGANSCILLCRRTVSESDWDLKTCQMITSLFFSSSFYLPLFPRVLSNQGSTPSPLFYSLLFPFTYVLFILFFPPPPSHTIAFSHPLALIFSLSHWPQTDSTVKGKQQSWWSANFMSFPWRFTAWVCVCVHSTLLDTGQQSHPLSCHSLWPKKPWVRSSR